MTLVFIATVTNRTRCTLRALANPRFLYGGCTLTPKDAETSNTNIRSGIAYILSRMYLH